MVPSIKQIYIAGGLLVILLGLIISPLPGPGGIPVIALGTIILLRQSRALRRRYVTYERRWPKTMRPFSKLLRRRRPNDWRAGE